MEKVKRISTLLEEKYGNSGRGAAQRLNEWLSGKVPYAYPEIVEQLLDERHLGLLFDSFWQVLPFGTGGRRGRVGYGPNRFNPTTIAMTIQGHCNYLRRTFGNRSDLAVVVANDVRQFFDVAGIYKFLARDHPLIGVSSRSLAKLAAQIYAANGFTAYLADPPSDKALLSTPELSFVISEMKAVGGINLSASHNPPDDNGVKVYDEFGSQPIAPNDQVLVEAMEGISEVRPMPFEEAIGKGLIREVPRDLHKKYVDIYEQVYAKVHTPVGNVPIVYTPLCGVGMTTVGDVLGRLKFPILTPPAEAADGTFAVIPFKAPNPEVPQATEPAKAFADKNGSGIVLSSDPDADRVGLEAKVADGTWYHFDGNQIAAILCYYLMLDPAGPRRKGLVIETLVTTKILGKIVEKAGGGSQIIDDLLVGFKYVANVLKALDKDGRFRDVTASSKQLVLAAEESHGVIVVPTIRDKDATPACMYLAALYQQLHQKGQTLLDYYTRILEEVGGFDTVNRSLTMTGAEGILRKDRIMESLRKSPPATIGGENVRKMIDFWDQKQFGPFVSKTDELPRNVIQLFTGTFVITIRPSGTEPKLKFYCQLLADKPSGAKGVALLKEVRDKADALALKIYNDLLAVIGVSLSEAALLLPDIIDLDNKQKFDQTMMPKFREALEKGTFENLDAALKWLRAEAAQLTPGADPLPALKAPLARLTNQWSASNKPLNLAKELTTWATS